MGYYYYSYFYVAKKQRKKQLRKGKSLLRVGISLKIYPTKHTKPFLSSLLYINIGKV